MVRKIQFCQRMKRTIYILEGTDSPKTKFASNYWARVQCRPVEHAPTSPLSGRLRPMVKQWNALVLGIQWSRVARKWYTKQTYSPVQEATQSSDCVWKSAIPVELRATIVRGARGRTDKSQLGEGIGEDSFVPVLIGELTDSWRDET